MRNFPPHFVLALLANAWCSQFGRGAAFGTAACYPLQNHAAMLKKSNVLCCGGLQLLNSSPPSSSPSAGGREGLLPRSSLSSQLGRWRQLATAHGNLSDDLSWPATTPFTPYDIFKQKPDAPYSKARYYELVKVYHPDRPCNDHPLCKDITQEVRMHRYHLVVAAHEILSDPMKRAAFDQFGVGWSYRTGATQDTSPPSWMRENMRQRGPIYANATWEDWERFYNEQNGKQPSAETRVDHRTFARLIILLALLGGTVQLSMIGRYNTGYEQRIRDVNEKSARFLTGRQRDTVDQPGSNETRVKQFLMRRDPSGSGLKGDEQDVYNGVLQSSSISGGNPQDSVGGSEQPGSAENPYRSARS